MVEALDNALDDLAYIHIHIGLHCDIDLGSVVTGQTRQAIKGVADRVEPGERNLERVLLLCLRCDLVNPIPQFEIGSAEGLFRRQKCRRGAAARHLLHDRVRRRKTQAIRPMPVQAGGVQIIVARDLAAGLPRGQPPINLSALDVLACTTFSCHAIHPYRLNAFTTKACAPTNLLIFRYAKLFPMKNKSRIVKKCLTCGGATRGGEEVG